jgi:hypothetical protein
MPGIGWRGNSSFGRPGWAGIAKTLI